jgi:hypothetical protein
LQRDNKDDVMVNLSLFHCTGTTSKFFSLADSGAKESQNKNAADY